MDLCVFAEVEAGPLERQDTVADAAIDFDRLMWHAGSRSVFAPWSLAVEEIDADGRRIAAVPHQWDEGRLYWRVPGRTTSSSAMATARCAT